MRVMQHAHLSVSLFSSYKAACNVHGVNGCPTRTPCTTGDRMSSECEGVVCTRLGKATVNCFCFLRTSPEDVGGR